MKSVDVRKISALTGRSREGAWIEIVFVSPCTVTIKVAPARERGLKYHARMRAEEFRTVAPARERGLKYFVKLSCFRDTMSLPRGSVD